MSLAGTITPQLPRVAGDPRGLHSDHSAGYTKDSPLNLQNFLVKKKKQKKHTAFKT